jgi:hypothetical protein
MTPSARLTAALLGLALAGPAVASTRIAIAPVKGDARGDVGAQLIGALCGARRCLPGALAGDRPDLARDRRMGADASLVSSIWRERGGRVLSLALFTTGARAARSWVLPLDPSGHLTTAQLDRLATELDDALGVRPPAGSSPAPEPAPPRLEPAATSARTAPLSLPAPPTPPPLAPAPRPPPGPWLAVEAGIEPAHLALRFPEGGTAPVGYTVTLPAAPRLRLELYPLRPAGGRAAGLALFADATWQPGIELPAGTRVHQASALRLRAGMLWRLPVTRWLVVVPALAWERESLVVAADGGVRLPGLPDTLLTGGSAALGLELPLHGTRFALLAGGRAAWWVEAGELAGGASFFPGGSASTLEAEAGAAVALAGPLSLRAVLRYAATRWSLDLDPSGAYTVRSALADSWGGRVVLRLEL